MSALRNLSPEEPLPPLPAIPSQVTLSPSVRTAFEELCADLHRQAEDYRKQVVAQYLKLDPHVAMTPQEIEAAFRFLERGGESMEPLPDAHFFWHQQAHPVAQFLQHPDLSPVAMVRALMLTEHCGLNRRGGAAWEFSHQFDELLRDYWKRHEVGFPLRLRELGAIFVAAGIPSDAIGTARLLGWQSAFQWSAPATWPYFAEHQHILAQALDLEPHEVCIDDWFWRYRRAARRRASFDILAMFPRIPGRFVDLCWEIALSSSKTERLWAQRTLGSDPDRFDRILAGLGSGKQEVRAAAAEWLSRLGDARAIKPLKLALAKERYDVPRGAEMAALERLGVPIDEFLDRPGLAAEAEKGLAKPLPIELAWFPFDRLPAVHWQDTGKRIPADVVRWWIVKSHKLKSPEPGAILRRYAALMRPAERAELGSNVLAAWIAEDTRPAHADELPQRAQRLHQQLGAYGMTYEEALEHLQQQPVGSAVAQKGILAIAGACCDSRAAVVVGEYLKRWYGMRAAQCRALVQMIAWVDHPAAIQLLLSTARRFRTTGIRKEAEKCVKALAERRDWTIAELADRSISTCGLDDGQPIVLDYGPRRFIARLDDELAFALSDAADKSIASLP
jgi:HEAT repeat protein